MAAEPTIILAGPRGRRIAHQAVDGAPDGSVVVIKKPRRSLDQNSKVHAVCTDIASQVVWNGKKRNVEAWKDILTAALLSARHDLDVVPGINGGFVLLGLHTSSLTKADCSDLIELAHAFGAEHGVVFGDEARDGATPQVSSAAQGTDGAKNPVREAV